jgi:hypothetical protein
MTLLRCYDDHTALLALECIKSLAIPPFAHRTLNFNHHVTALHKTSSHCAPLFQVAEAANWSPSSSSPSLSASSSSSSSSSSAGSCPPLVARDFLLSDEQFREGGGRRGMRLEFDISQKPKVSNQVSRVAFKSTQRHTDTHICGHKTDRRRQIHAFKDTCI